MSHGAAQTGQFSGSDAARLTAGLMRAAGYCLFAAIATLIVAGVALALYFSGAGDIFGPVNDLFTAATLALLVPAVVAVWRLANGRVGGWLTIVSVATIAGMVLAAIGFVLLVVGVIDLQTSFVTFGLGMLPFLAWIAGLADLSLREGIIGRWVGWWIVAFALGTVASVVSAFVLPMEILTLTLAPVLFFSLAGVLVSLGRDLLAWA